MAKLKVIGYQVLMPAPYAQVLPGIRCLLDNGKTFEMGSIPFDVAVAVEKLANGNDLTEDDRLGLPLILSKLPDIERVLGNSIKNIFIDRVQQRGRSLVYGATVLIELNGKAFEHSMVPSNAILLSLLAGVDVLVDERFLMRQEGQRYIA